MLTRAQRKQALSVKRAGLHQGPPRRIQRRQEAQLCRDRRAPDRPQELRPPARQAFLGHRQVRIFLFFLPSTPTNRLARVCRLPHVPRPRMSICILADAADIDRAKQIDLEYMSVDDLKKCVYAPALCPDRV